MRWIPTLLAATALAAAALATAHEGEDHGTPASPAVTQAVPRFEAQSELFELVGVLEGPKLTLYLDRYSDNTPITDAKIEVEAPSFKGEAVRAPDGTYTLAAEPLARPGRHALTITVSAGADVDLLAGELETHASATSNGKKTASDEHSSWLSRYWSRVVTLLVVAALAVPIILRLRLRGAK